LEAWWLMREMRWSWADYERTPEYVRLFCAELSQLAQRLREAKMKRDG
jgi:hypothetical protein